MKSVFFRMPKEKLIKKKKKTMQNVENDYMGRAKRC
jgi:hypothetical protein